MTVFDTTVRPQDDFFKYVNQPWLDRHPIPPSKSAWGSFYVLRDKSANAIRGIVKELASTPDSELSHDQKLIKTFFKSALSYKSHGSANLKTIRAEIGKITAISNVQELAYYLGYASRHEFGAFWSNYVSVDDKNSRTQIFGFRQNGLTLPNRDYYLDNSPTMKTIRKKYKLYFDAVQTQLPDDTSSDWDSVFDIEHQLAKASWTDIQLRDVEKSYTRFTVKQLQTQFPSFDWTAYFKGTKWNNPSDNIVINQVPFIEKSLKIIAEEPLEKIKAYLTWQLIGFFIGWINKECSELAFDFFGQILEGRQVSEPVWKRAVRQTEGLIIGEVLGREYAARFFPESSKKEVLDMVEAIRSAYHARIDRVTWMNPVTKTKAHKKLDNIKVLIGYPSVWPKLAKLKFTPDNHLMNMLASTAYDTTEALKKVGKPPKPDDWQMNAHTVNAYHDPNQLIICFPAAILQPPFYSPKVSRATNLGGIGAVIGHELTHGFDDQGSQFDEYGNVVQWQSDAEIASFQKLTKMMVKQADSYEVLPGVFLKGELVIGETIADIGGLELAIEALGVNPGITKQGLRKLFTNFAETECGTTRPEALLQLAKIDPHPPSPFRVNYVIKQVDWFYTTYNVQPGDALYLAPDERVHIW